MTTAIAPDLPEFLADWKMAHRPLSEANRAAAGRYIEVIVSRRPLGGPENADFERRRLWRQLRERFDDLGGERSRLEQEDFAKAMSCL